ncbi:hypothetical protein POM88_046509 [Heracleum sosnowskyi]|uniref:F-box domain-containing protein n=1 Tax=Heracleum sosnowskyi TaxID=360622 RepID=A0AAD8H9K6_9APIA|nr:hypothetical protein POM88_046509 [Heracleum sosnowskyi]
MSIPCDLIEKILQLLPVKYVLRARCVSKEWCSLIDTKAFAKNHFKRAIKRFHITGVLICGVKNFSRLISRVVKDGFVMLNPATRKFRDIHCENSQKVWCYGFGYDRSTDDYKVVKIRWFEHRGEVEVYGFRSNSWKRLQDIIAGDCSFLSSRGILVSDSLYWIGFDDTCLVYGFDLGFEEFRKFPLPELNVKWYSICLSNLDGQLCITDNYRGSHTNVWILNNFGAENPWRKVYTVEKPDYGSFRYIVKVVAASESGDDVLFEGDRTKLFWYNLGEKAFMDDVQGIPARFNTLLYTESLVQVS